MASPSTYCATLRHPGLTLSNIFLCKLSVYRSQKSWLQEAGFQMQLACLYMRGTLLNIHLIWNFLVSNCFVLHSSGSPNWRMLQGAESWLAMCKEDAKLQPICKKLPARTTGWPSKWKGGLLPVPFLLPKSSKRYFHCWSTLFQTHIFILLVIHFWNPTEEHQTTAGGSSTDCEHCWPTAWWNCSSPWWSGSAGQQQQQISFTVFTITQRFTIRQGRTGRQDYRSRRWTRRQIPNSCGFA